MSGILSLACEIFPGHDSAEMVVRRGARCRIRGHGRALRCPSPARRDCRLDASASLDALARARKHVQEYFDKFSDLTCKESVTQIVLNGSGHAIYRENSAYDYQFQATSESGTLKFNETRETRNPAFRDPARTLLVTTGFASLLLVAHPMYEASYVFEPAGAETIGGVSYSMIRFIPVPGASSPASLRLRGKNYPLPLSGTLWIDPQSGAIVKLEAKVDSSLSDLGLAGMRSEVHYALHQFPRSRGIRVGCGVGCDRRRYPAPALAQPAPVHGLQEIQRQHS